MLKQPLPPGKKLDAVQMKDIKGGWEDSLYPNCNADLACGSVYDCYYYMSICQGTTPIDGFCIQNTCIFEF
jgi:hypothetical protein